MAELVEQYIERCYKSYTMSLPMRLQRFKAGSKYSIALNRRIDKVLELEVTVDTVAPKSSFTVSAKSIVYPEDIRILNHEKGEIQFMMPVGGIGAEMHVRWTEGKRWS